MSDILLTTINAKYIHTAFGLRYLRSNLLELKDLCEIQEFTIQQDPAEIVASIMAANPKILGLGVYIWNVSPIKAVIERIKLLKPQIHIVLGGPEISYATESHPLWHLADFIITGEGETSFYKLAKKLLHNKRPLLKVIAGEQPDVQTMSLPYALYTPEDLAHRILYVEASRGCPFRCEFCLSSLDQKVRAFELDSFLQAMDSLWEKGARQFKFVDRTFNLSAKTCTQILSFFFERLDEKTFLHFEMVPDRLPEAIKEWIQKFPPGVIQFEIGIQTLNPEVAQRISRKQNYEKTKRNFAYLTQETGVHIHADLILGLPGETLTSIENGFNSLLAMNPHEIQVGILKRLPGTPIDRHTDTFEMIYNPSTPYEILQNNTINFDTMQRLKHFARYFDAFVNSGHFKQTWQWFCAQTSPFATWLSFCDWLYDTTRQTHKFSMTKRAQYLFNFLTEQEHVPKILAQEMLEKDLVRNKHKGRPQFSGAHLRTTKKPKQSGSQRQQRHKDFTTTVSQAG